MPTSSVYPSGGAFATASPATLPLPPMRFSMTKGWPSASPSFAAIRRPTISGPPPGGIGTSIFTGFAGYCASAAGDSRSARQTAKALTTFICGGGDAVEVVLPDMEIAFAGGDRGVFHAQFPGELLYRAPAGVGMLDVGFAVQFEELELLVREAEEPAPAQPLEAEPAVLAEHAAAVARHIDALGAGIGDDALEPVAVRPPSLPRPPGEPGPVQRS